MDTTRDSSGRFDALLLDADGVVQWNPSFRQRMGDLLGPTIAMDDLMALEREALTGERDLAADLTGFLASRGVGVSPDEVFEVWFDTTPDPAALELVERVRASGVPTYLGTNQQRQRGTHMRENLGYERYFDEQFHSFELGIAKPDPGFFTAITERLGLRPERVLFVDDMVENVEGARSAGLVAEHLPHGSGARGLADILSRHGFLAP